MIRKYTAFFIGLVILSISAYAHNFAIDENVSNKILFYDNMRSAITEDWRFYCSGDAAYGTAEHDGKSVLALIKNSENTWSSSMTELKADIGKEYTITTNIKVENNPDAGTIKSFEYVYFNIAGGKDAYRLEWFYGTNLLKLQKNNKNVAETDTSKIKDYSKYDWNKYSFEVADDCIKIYINGVEVLSYEDSGLADNQGTFAVNGITTYPKNVNVFLDDVVVTEPHTNKIVFYDDFSDNRRSNWSLTRSGDGEGKFSEIDGNGVLNITKYTNALTSAPKATIKADIGSSYYATAKIKVEKNPESPSIKSFEYFRVDFASGKANYMFEWTYSVGQLRLYKNNKMVLEKDASFFPGYSQFDWNEYGFEVTEKQLRIFINGREFMKYNDDELAENEGKFDIYGLTTYPRNVNIYIDDVMVTKMPTDSIWIDSKNYKCTLTDEGKIRLECRIYGPESRDVESGTLIGALYQEGVLKGTATQKVNIPAGKLSDTVILEFDAEDLFHELDLKLMLWDGDNGLVPIGNTIEDKTGYFIEDFSVLDGGTLVYDTDFSGWMPDFTIIDSSYRAGGYRKDTVGGNDVLYLFGGYAKKGEERKFGVVLPETFNGYAMDVTLRSHKFLSETASVILNYQSDESYYAFTWTRGGFPDIYSEYPVQKFRLCQNGMTDIIAPKYEEIPDKNTPFITKSYRIYVLPERILVYRKDDGTPLFSYEPTRPIEPGKIGFMTGGTGNGNMRFYIDDLKVWTFNNI